MVVNSSLNVCAVMAVVTFLVLLNVLILSNKTVLASYGSSLTDKDLGSSSSFQLQVPPSNMKTNGDRAFSLCPPSFGTVLPVILNVAPVLLISENLSF